MNAARSNFMLTLAGVFAAGKVWGVVAWSWWWVLAPLWVLAVAWIVVLVRANRARRIQKTQ